MKYIMFKINGGELPVIFPPEIIHKQMARNIGAEVISAGHITSDLGCYGESETLGIKSRIEDTKRVQELFSIPDDAKMKLVYNDQKLIQKDYDEE